MTRHRLRSRFHARKRQRILRRGGQLTAFGRPGRRASAPPEYLDCSDFSHEAAKESNLPSGGLHRPTGFEDQMGHQTPAAPARGYSGSSRCPTSASAGAGSGRGTPGAQHVPISLAHRHLGRVEVLEQGLGVLAARPERVAELRDRDLSMRVKELQSAPATQPGNLPRLRLPRGGRGLVAHLVFKTSRAWQPHAWKVRFLRRSAYSTRMVPGEPGSNAPIRVPGASEP